MVQLLLPPIASEYMLPCYHFMIILLLNVPVSSSVLNQCTRGFSQHDYFDKIQFMFCLFFAVAYHVHHVVIQFMFNLHICSLGRCSMILYQIIKTCLSSQYKWLNLGYTNVLVMCVQNGNPETVGAMQRSYRKALISPWQLAFSLSLFS